MKYKNIMFDLDGTITDSGKPIMESAQHALDQFGFFDQPIEIMRKFVGPSLMDSFQNLFHMTEDEAEKAVRIYREYYENETMFQVEIYEGIEEVLKQNVENGCENFLVTSKPYVFAEKILERFDLRKYFTGIIGPDMSDPSSDKSRLINKAMDTYNLKREECVMIGDTKFDIEGANQSGIDSIGVTYGYGLEEDLRSAGATYVVENAFEIVNYI